MQYNLERLNKLKQEYLGLLGLYSHGQIIISTYNMGTIKISEIDSEIKKLEKLIKELKIELKSSGVIY